MTRLPAKVAKERRLRYKGHEPKPFALRECPQRKLAYKTERMAKEVAAKSFKLNGFILFVYRCPHCRFWHLTKREQAS